MMRFKGMIVMLGLLACSETSSQIEPPPDPPGDPGPTPAHAIAYSTFFGGSLGDRTAGDQLVDSHGNLYVAGSTGSPDFPTTDGAYDRTHNGVGSNGGDGFVAKFDSTGTLLWSTLIGGPGRDELYGIGLDAQGFVYVGGAFSAGAPTTPGTIQPQFAGGPEPWDGYLAKLSPDGSALIWATYVGTPAQDGFRNMTLDSRGNVIAASNYNAGTSYPASWFATGFQTAPQGDTDVIVLKVSSDGSRVLWGTYLGGSGAEGQPNLAVDAQDNVHVLIETTSPDIPTTAGALDRTFNGGHDAWAAKLSADGSRLIYATYLGTVDEDGTGGKSGIAVDPQGNAVITAYTRSSAFPTSPGAAHPTAVEFTSWGVTGVVVKLSATGDMIAGSYMGHQGSVEAVAVDAQGNIYTVGQSERNGLSVTADAVQENLAGLADAFVEKLSPDLTSVLFATYLGGSGEDIARMVIEDRTNRAVYVTGTTTSGTDFPIVKAWQAAYGGSGDIFITKIAF